MRKPYVIILSAIFTAVLTGCLNNPEMTGVAPKDPVIPKDEKVVQPAPPPAPKKHTVYTQGADRPIVYEPKADILFVVDTSDSMTCDQQKLKNEIGKFTQAFTSKQGRFLDFHMGVVAVWDSKLYETPINGVKPRRQCANGQLRPVGGGPCTPDGLGKENFVTKQTANLQSTLAKTLHLGVEKYISEDSLGVNPSDEKRMHRAENSGPQDEELFSPVLKALSVEGAKINPNFRRKDVPLSVIFITDTDDATPGWTPSDFVEGLKNEAGDGKVSTYGVFARYDDLLAFERNPNQNPLVPYTVGNMNSCSNKNGKVDPAIAGANQGPFRMRDVILNTTNGATIATGFDIDDSQYGEKLAAIAANITRQSLKTVIQLDYPRNILEPMTVMYGTQKIEQNDETGYSYNVINGIHTVTINEGVVLNEQKDAGFTIKFTIAD